MKLTDFQYDFGQEIKKQAEVSVRYVGGVTSLWFARYMSTTESGRTPEEALSKLYPKFIDYQNTQKEEEE